MTEDLNAEAVIAGHAVDAYVWRVSLADVHRRGTSASVSVGRRATEHQSQDDQQVPAAEMATTTGQFHRRPVCHHRQLPAAETTQLDLNTSPKTRLLHEFVS